MHASWTLLLGALHVWRGGALPVNHTDDQLGAVIESGTFQKPSVNVRPRFRYWLPDASIDAEFLVDDIAQLAARGAGGIELLNYFDYGGLVGRGPSTDWNIYGFGTQAYRDILKAALQAHKDLGLIMDFSLGPQSGQGVPADPDEPGLAYVLEYYNVSLSAGEAFTGTLPGWGRGELVSAVTFGVANVTNVRSIVSQFALVAEQQGWVNSTLYTILSSSLTDVTSSVQEDGSISVEAPSIDDISQYFLVASYYAKSYTKACIASSDDPQNILQNGSFVVDHFSQAGARLTTGFLEDYILTDGIAELFRETGNYMWEDSVEIPGFVFWTPELVNVFQQQHNYSVAQYAPLLAGRNGWLAQAAWIGPVFFKLDTEDEGAGIVSDWRQTMTHLQATYYEALTDWANSYLNLQFSAQVGYNTPVDMLANIPVVNAPETESLSFNNAIDGFRQYVGPANLAGKRVISVELGSDYLETFTQSWTDLLKDAKRGFVVGVNQLIFHGALYSHTYPNTTWPGFTSFSYTYGGHHSRHQPAWDVGYSEAVEYAARAQHLLQVGVPKVDLVFWDKQTAQLAYPEPLYHSPDLSAAGYTYSYLSPDNFALDAASVSDRVLAPSAQAFRALILRGNDTLTVAGVLKLAEYATRGLPIIISGGIPLTYNTINQTGISQARAALESILILPNVHSVPYEDLASEITAIGVSPRTMVNSNGTWVTHWREDENGDITVLVYNDGKASTGSVAFETTLRPTYLDAWSGEEYPVVLYTVDGKYTNISFTLGYTETAIIKFSNGECAQYEHIVSAPSSALVSSYALPNSWPSARFAASSTSEAGPIVLSNGSHIRVPPEIPSAFDLTKWSLTLEHWHAPDDFFNVEIDANKTNTTWTLNRPQLPAWADISTSLTNVSGIGYYNTTFKWPPSCYSGNLGAVLRLPPISHGIVATLNGHDLPPLDITNPTVDVSQYLVSGTNVFSARVASTLWNTLRPIWGDLRTGTSTPSPSTPEEFEIWGYGFLQKYGIVGRVQVVPYVAVPL